MAIQSAEEDTETKDEPERPRGQVHVFLRILGRDLDPGEITRILESTPSEAFRRGDPFTAGDRTMSRAYGVWTMSTKGRIESEDLIEHCRYLLAWASPIRERIAEYLCRTDVRVAVAYWWQPSDGPVGFTLPAELMRDLAGVCDEFDFYFA